MTARAIHVIVVAYHAPEQLDLCLQRLRGEPVDVSITVVDNSSSPAVRDAVQRNGAEYLDAGQNLGFAAGVNLALRSVAGGVPLDVLLLNPDATLSPDDLLLLTDYLHLAGNERVAAVSPRLSGNDGTEQRVVWPFPNPARAWAEAVGFRRIPARHTFVVGAVMALRWEAILEVGLFDERFFLYAEETDWQRRALSLGWSSSLCTTAVASHVGAGTSTDSYTRETRFHAAQETYIRKWYGRFGWLLYRQAALLGATLRALVLVGERRAEATRRAHIYLRGPRRCAALNGD